MSDSARCEFKQNLFEYGFKGISIIRSNNTIISGNRFVSLTSAGVYGDFVNTTLTDNIFEGTGVSMFERIDQLTYAFPFTFNNTVNGKALGFFMNITSAQIDAEQYGQLIMGKCNDTTIVGGSFENCGIGIQLTACDNITVDSASVSDCLESKRILPLKSH